MLTNDEKNGFPTRAMLLWAGAVALTWTLVLGGDSCRAQEDAGSEYQLGSPGYLVIEAGRDSTAGFRWEAGPGPGFRSLVWDQGRLTLPDSLQPENLGPWDVGVPCTAQLAGTGASGQLVLQDGIYPVSEPVILSDGRLKMEVSGGELEFRGARIRYRQSGSEPAEFRAGLLMLAGMTLLVLVLLRRARLKADEGAGI